MNKKTTGIVAYITWIGWLVAFLAGDKEGAKFHINQALVINLTSIVISIAGRVLGLIPLVGWILSLALSIFSFVLWVMGLVYACKEEEKEVPLVGQIKILK